jgi:hypothetical protein
MIIPHQSAGFVAEHGCDFPLLLVLLPRPVILDKDIQTVMTLVWSIRPQDVVTNVLFVAEDRLNAAFKEHLVTA